MDIGLYIHIPFCLSKCYYCDFTSYAHSKENYRPYIEALMNEIKVYGAKVGQSLVVKTIFIGGGTPSVLPPILLGKIMKSLKRSFYIDEHVEYTIESNPGTLSRDKLKVMKDHGVNRISIGVQAYQNHLLKRIGRAHTWDQVEESYGLCRELGFDNINLDLIFGLPGQTITNWQETLEQIKRLGPNHISTYSLIIEENTPFGRLYDNGKLDPIDEELERRMYHYAKDYLNQNGYEQYEISNFAKPGKASQHNIDCWKARPYIGMGLGAHSYFQGSRYHNTDKMSDYIANSGQLSKIQKNKEKINLKAQIEEYMFLGLRLTDGISMDDFEKKFKRHLEDVYGLQINKHKNNGLLKEKNGRIFLTTYGQDISNIVFSSFLE